MRAIASVTATALLITALTLAAPQPASAGPIIHVVRSGENLYRIALRYGVSVEAIARANRLADPERLQPGQRLTIPVPATTVRRKQVSAVRPRSHVVARGDTLYAIARRYRTTVTALKRANGLRSDRLQIGQRLAIPGRGTILATRQFPIQPVPATLPPGSAPVQRTTEVLPAPEVGAQIPAPQALRIRRGPQSYFTTLALVAPETPLVILSVDNHWYEVQLPDGQTGWVPEDDLLVIERVAPANPDSVHGADIVRDAMRYLGTRYVWGGTSGRGVDCSGFVYVVFSNRIPGLARQRSYDYFMMGAPVNGSDLLPGDLVFFTTYAPGPSHVGIYIGDGKFIQASSGARQVVVTSLNDPYYAARYLGARRLLKP